MEPKPRKPVIGWREWLSLPELGISAIKAKVDTGARSSALHAFDVQVFEQDGRNMVRFQLHPFQRDTVRTVYAVSELIGYRTVRSSEGTESMRPVILTTVELLGQQWNVEVTLTRRDNMGFRMLLGRQAVRRRFVIDPGKSFIAGRLHDQRKSKRTS